MENTEASICGVFLVLVFERNGTVMIFRFEDPSVSRFFFLNTCESFSILDEGITSIFQVETP